MKGLELIWKTTEQTNRIEALVSDLRTTHRRSVSDGLSYPVTEDHPPMDLQAIPCCRLCQQARPLRISHVIPKFVFRWINNTSATGFFRFGLNPNKRQQDGLKQPLLCEDCEQRLSGWERAFAEQIFVTLREGQGFEPVRHGPWLAKFTASLSWRVLLELQSFKALSHLPPEVLSEVDVAEATWRQFLLDKRVLLSPFNQHLVPLGYLASHTLDDDELPPNMNRYIASTVALDLVHAEQHTFVFTKLPFAVIIGMIRSTRPWEWIGTSIQPGDGLFGIGKSITVPGGLHHYMANKARRVTEIHRGLSDRQRAVIDDFVAKNPDRVANSRTFEAMNWDVQMFGHAAFEKRERPQDAE